MSAIVEGNIHHTAEQYGHVTGFKGTDSRWKMYDDSMKVQLWDPVIMAWHLKSFSNLKIKVNC